MSRRRLSDDERVLWKGVTRSIAPLRKLSQPEPDDAEPAPAPPPPKPRAKSAPCAVAAGRAAEARCAAAARTADPQDEEAHRARRAAIDGRLDLHGMTQAEAHDALFAFLRARQARGGKLVLVITGKGARGGEAAAACSSAWCRCGSACRNSAS